jgi:ABC-type sulfate/molybdate transport systems ATPase subunit/nucleotide-binding universal stress UspA family protein
MSIVLDHVSKWYGPHPALDEVSLEVTDGELFVLLGGSGSGKSTALRIIAGLTPPDDGHVILQGTRVDDLPPQKRGVGFVFQNYSLFRHMTVGENIEFGMRVHRVPEADRIRRREELLSLIGLEGLAHALPQRLSGGQQQRIAVARALAYEPSVLLMDEPFGALDVRTRSQLRSSFREIQRKLRVTTILVTHDQDEAFALAHRIGILDRGHLVEVGPPTALYRRPRTELVATFLGAANVLMGEVRSGSLQVGSTMLDLPPEVPPSKGSMEVKVVIRPEDLEARPAGEWTKGRTLGEGRIREIFHAGPLLRLRIGVPALAGVPVLVPEPAYGQEEPTLIAHALPESSGAAGLAPGAAVCLDVRNLHVIPHEGISLLVCLDGSELSRQCLEFGAALANQMHGRLVVMGVAEKPNEEARARAGLSRTTQEFAEGFRNLQTRFRVGNAAERILQETERGEYGIVVVGFRGRHGPARTMGSTSSRLLRESRIPVLVVPAPRPSLRRVLICLSTGATARNDVVFAGRLAARAGADATLLHVRGFDGGSPSLHPDVATAEYLRHLTTERLARGILTLKLMGVTSEMKVRSGTPSEQILREAREGDYDLITLGAPEPPGGTGPQRREMFDNVLEEARQPVLVVPAPREEKTRGANR